MLDLSERLHVLKRLVKTTSAPSKLNVIRLVYYLFGVNTQIPTGFVDKLQDLFDLKSAVLWSELVVIPGGSPQDVDPPNAPTDTILEVFFCPCIL